MTLTIILLSLVAALGTKFGYPKYIRLKNKALFRRHFSSMLVLEENEWRRLKKTIKEECKGYLYGDALIGEIFQQGYRFNCKQIYELRQMYLGWGVKEYKDHVDRITSYALAAKADAEEKIFELLHEDRPLLLNKNSEPA